ncbi:MAG: hypothetical protein HON78_04640 [Legionellales bacterium]|nr:hypothetical protein [Legionellales bacterium]
MTRPGEHHPCNDGARESTLLGMICAVAPIIKDGLRRRYAPRNDGGWWVAAI